MIKYLSALIVLLSSCSSSEKQQENTKIQNAKVQLKTEDKSDGRFFKKYYNSAGVFISEIRVVKIDSCEYIQIHSFTGEVRLIPKTDCKFCLSHKK